MASAMRASVPRYDRHVGVLEPRDRSEHICRDGQCEPNAGSVHQRQAVPYHQRKAEHEIRRSPPRGGPAICCAVPAGAGRGRRRARGRLCSGDTTKSSMAIVEVFDKQKGILAFQRHAPTAWLPRSSGARQLGCHLIMGQGISSRSDRLSRQLKEELVDHCRPRP
jgi:hypothetical protein